MEKKKLHIALRQVVKQFGYDVLTENKLVNILLDYGAYSDIPASKTIIQAILTAGYSKKFIDLGRKKHSFMSYLLKFDNQIDIPEGTEWRNKLNSYSAEISKRNGFQQPLVDYVIECWIYGLGWSDIEPEVPISITSAPAISKPATSTTSQSSASITSKPLAPQPTPAAAGTTSGKNTNKSNSVSYHQIINSQFLVMQVSPINAIVLVDGKQQYVSNGMMAVELPVGTHTYEVKADSYETKTGTFDISSSAKTELDVALVSKHQNVELTIKAADSDTEIIINGVSYGKGYWQGLVEKGDYVIEGRKHRYYPHKQTISLIIRGKEIVHIPSLNAICGSLKVNVQPYGSKIIINGEEKGVTPLLLNNIIVGERALTIKTEEGTKYTPVVEVKENQVTDVNHIIPSLFLYDYSEVKLGDYFYEDGSFSHEKALGKEMVGMVFSLDTSEEEKKMGWTHGQIIALKDIKDKKTGYIPDGFSWGIPTKEILQYAIHGPADKINNKDNGYLITHLDSVLNNPEFKPFLLASQYDAKLPYGKTSGWYLPCIQQWKILEDNISTLYNDYSEGRKKYWDFLGLYTFGYKIYTTCSIHDSKKAWKYQLGRSEKYRNDAYIKEAIDDNSIWGIIRAVASF